jgi:hypothetical protein
MQDFFFPIMTPHIIDNPNVLRPLATTSVFPIIQKPIQQGLLVLS